MVETDFAVAWQKVAEGLDWFAFEQPIVQAVTWRDPLAVGNRIASWDIPVHPGRFPTFLENINLKGG